MIPSMRRAVLALVICGTSVNPTRGVQAQSGAGVAPPVPFEDVGACPFEGCVYREWTAKRAIVIRTDRRPDAPVGFRLKAGEKVTAVTGVVVTVKPGRVQFREPSTLRASNGNIHIRPGQTLYLLTYQGEGFTKAWFNGRLYRDVDTVEFLNGVCDRDPNRCAGTLIEKSQTEWWIQIRTQSGKVGWTNEPRQFDGKDAFG
jgi:hypothetical protein